MDLLGLEKYGTREGRVGKTRLDRGQVARFKHGCADESHRLIVKDQGLAPVAGVASDTHTPETENNRVQESPGGAARTGNDIAELGLPSLFIASAPLSSDSKSIEVGAHPKGRLVHEGVLQVEYSEVGFDVRGELFRCDLSTRAHRRRRRGDALQSRSRSEIDVGGAALQEAQEAGSREGS